MKIVHLFLGALLISAGTLAQPLPPIDLSGLWRFQLDPMGFGKTPGSELYLKTLTETMVLPGSTDQSGKGVPNIVAHIDRLSRRFEYAGQAWYQREVLIPPSWKDKELLLTLERCHWETTIYVDGKYIAEDERLSTPNRFVLTKALPPGLHTLTICVDNRLKYPMDQWAHGITEYTQTNWNGIVGEMQLTAIPKIRIAQVDVYPSIKDNKAIVKLRLAHPKNAGKGNLYVRLRKKGEKEVLATKRQEIALTDSTNETLAVVDLALSQKAKLWDEFHPHLYELEAEFQSSSGADQRLVSFGFREVEQGIHHIRLNGRDIHLRGTLECAVFPLTGYPATDIQAWKRILTIVKTYGMNHVRFHSWCPPKAAFDAADELGVYLQVELPMWIKDVGKYPLRRVFFEREMYAVLNEYGNHPSFILFCNGNENEGDFSVLEDLVRKGKAYDQRHLYSASTARTHVKADQYYTSHVTSKGGITVYEGKPSTDWDKNQTSDIDVPVIAHETGQRCMYPNFNEIPKYLGVLEARNFKKFQESLTRQGMLPQANDFFEATGAHTILQYKEVNESLLRTSKSGGFQLLGLSDFPGQGSAFVGILDAFWDSKGLVSPEVYRQSCAPTVLLARFPKRTYTNEDTFNARLEIYHYGEFPIAKSHLKWQLKNQQGTLLKQGTLSTQEIPVASVHPLGSVSIPLRAIARPEKLTLYVSLANTTNQWDVWVYPSSNTTTNTPTYVYTRTWDESTKAALNEGKNVLLIPQKTIGRKTRFAGHFWNPIMFKWKPMIVGTLIHATHPAFADFPTAKYADWQWWDILNGATAMDLDPLENITPVIQSIDSYETNHKLGIAFEATVGKGNLFVLSADVEKNLPQRPAMRQLLLSIQNYVNNPSLFHPQQRIEPYKLDALFSDPTHTPPPTASDAAIKQLLNH